MFFEVYVKTCRSEKNKAHLENNEKKSCCTYIELPDIEPVFPELTLWRSDGCRDTGLYDE